VRKWLALTALILLIMAGCVARVRPGMQVSMSEGERLYRANCRSCHLLRNPASYTDEQWPPLVERYGSRIPLSPETKQKIVDYLLSAN